MLINFINSIILLTITKPPNTNSGTNHLLINCRTPTNAPSILIQQHILNYPRKPPNKQTQDTRNQPHKTVVTTTAPTTPTLDAKTLWEQSMADMQNDLTKLIVKSLLHQTYSTAHQPIHQSQERHEWSNSWYSPNHDHPQPMVHQSDGSSSYQCNSKTLYFMGCLSMLANCSY